MSDHRHALTKQESELARKLFRSIYTGDNQKSSDQRTREILGIMVYEFRQAFHYSPEDEEVYFIKALHGARLTPIAPKVKCIMHRKLYTNRYFPEIRSYGIGWYCSKCGEFQYSPGMS